MERKIIEFSEIRESGITMKNELGSKLLSPTCVLLVLLVSNTSGGSFKPLYCKEKTILIIELSESKENI